MRGSRAVSVGSTLGSYTIERELGHGGMGAVYVGVHRLLGRRAAIKVLLPKFTRDDDVVQRFFDEARAASAIKHPSIVEIYDYGVAGDGAAYIVMELCDGESLAQRLRRERPVTLPFALAIARQIAVALGVAHAAGIVHRDLKPDNVFVVRDPEVAGGERIKLLDFGIAKLAREGGGPGVTESGALLGTPTYMAPEQCRGAGEVDHRADLYALGCILYEMVCGRVPFAGEGSGDVIGAHLLVAPRPPRELAPALPAEVEALILKLLAKSPAERYQSADDVARALQRVATSGPAVAYASTLASGETVPSGVIGAPSVRPPRRRVSRSVPGAAAIALGVALGVAAFALREDGVPDASPPPPAPHEVGDLPAIATAHVRVNPPIEVAPGLDVTVDDLPPVRVDDLVLVDRSPPPAGGRWAPAMAVGAASETDPTAVVLVVEGSEAWLGNDDDTPAGSDDRVAGAFHDVVSAVDAARAAWPMDTRLELVTYGNQPNVVVPPTPAGAVGGALLGAQRDYRGQLGHDLAGALEVALDTLVETGATRKAIVVIGDGTDTDDESAKPRLVELARRAAVARVSVWPIVVADRLTNAPATAIRMIRPLPTTLERPGEIAGALQRVIEQWKSQAFDVQFHGDAFVWDGRPHDLALRVGGDDRYLVAAPVVFPPYTPWRRFGWQSLALALAGVASIVAGALALRRLG